MSSPSSIWIAIEKLTADVRDCALLFDTLAARVDEFHARLDALEEKRGPGRPKKEHG